MKIRYLKIDRSKLKVVRYIYIYIIVERIINGMIMGIL